MTLHYVSACKLYKNVFELDTIKSKQVRNKQTKINIVKSLEKKNTFKQHNEVKQTNKQPNNKQTNRQNNNAENYF